MLREFFVFITRKINVDTFHEFPCLGHGGLRYLERADFNSKTLETS